MESHSKDLKVLVTKISYISHLMKYYGYLHESAELFLQLNRASRMEWESNLKGIVQVIMSHPQSKMIMEIQGPFTPRIAEFVLKTKAYLFYRLAVSIDKTGQINALIKLVDQIELIPADLFYNCLLSINTSNSMRCNAFVQLCQCKGIGLDNIKLNPNSSQTLLFNKNSKSFSLMQIYCSWNALFLFTMSERYTHFIERTEGEEALTTRLTVKSITIDCSYQIEHLNSVDFKQLKIPQELLSAFVDSWGTLFNWYLEKNGLRENAILERIDILGSFIPQPNLNDMLCDINRLLNFYPNVHSLFLPSNAGNQSAIDVIFVQSQVEEEVKNLQQISTLWYSNNIINNDLNIVKRNCQFLLNLPQGIKIYQASILKVNCNFHEYRVLDDSVILVDSLRNLTVSNVKEIPPENDFEVEIYQTSCSEFQRKTSSFPILILQNWPIVDFKADDFWEVKSEINETSTRGQRAISQRFSFWCKYYSKYFGALHTSDTVILDSTI
jgi:hypothetical protein